MQTTQASTSSLITADFDTCGAINNPTEGATRIDIGAISTSTYNTWTLNATGRGWISLTGWTKLGISEGHDAIDSKVANGTTDAIGVYYSEWTGTDRDPYLYITYTVPNPDRSWATGSADFEIWRSSDLTWDVGSLVCGGSLTDDNGSTISCNYLAVVPSTQYRVQVILKNTGDVLVKGVIALQFALDHPEMTDGLIVVSSSSEVSEKAVSMYEQMAALIEQRGMQAFAGLENSIFAPEFIQRNPGVVAEYGEKLLRNDPKGYAAAARAVSLYNLTPELGKIGCSSLLIVGDKDTTVRE